MKMNRLIVMAGFAGILCAGSGRLLAQGGAGGGNFDPAQMQQQIQQMLMDNYRAQLEVKDDAEWKVLQERIQKVVDARQEVGLGGMGLGMLGRMGRRGGGNAAQNPGAGGGGGRRGGLGAFFGSAGPEEQALQQAIDSNAPSAALRAALAKFNDARKAKQAKLESAQAELRKVLSIRQEAIASVSGLL